MIFFLLKPIKKTMHEWTVISDSWKEIYKTFFGDVRRNNDVPG